MCIRDSGGECSVPRDGGPPGRHAERRGRGGQALLAALIVVSPGRHPQSAARRPGAHGRHSAAGAVLTDALVEAKAAGDLMAARRLEDERFAYFAEASIVFLDLPDAVFRGYEGDDELLGMPRPDDRAPVYLLVREIARLEPQKVYLPLGVGNHVDHQLMREVGVALLE